MNSTTRRVAITGMGLICPLGSTKEALWEALSQGRSAVGPLAAREAEALSVRVAAEAKQFTADANDFGPLEKEQKKQIRKALRVMCRECQMGVAVAQLALADAGLSQDKIDPDRIGVSYGTDYMLTLPDEFNEGIRTCVNGSGKFDFSRWGLEGLPKMSPLWLLKYLPNMPASHVAIFNDLRGPSNSLTLREAGSNLAIGEAFHIIRRGHADAMVCGATGTRLHTMKLMHTVTQEEVAAGNGDPAKVSRPFDQKRSGMVLGEGAAAIIIEELDRAAARGATIYGEIVAASSRAAADVTSGSRMVARRKVALLNTMRALLQDSGCRPEEIDHLHAHGLSTRSCDAEEAQAIAEAFGPRAATLPVVAAKSYFGNLGAGSGMVELIASLLAMRGGTLFPTLNYETPDAECPIRVVHDHSTLAGKRFINVNVTPQGQASGLLVQQ
jgi:3-oxoacyl-[acyl-carrier-protein] synthase II